MKHLSTVLKDNGRNVEYHRQLYGYSRWQYVRFQDLRKGMLLRIRQQGGEVFKDAAGRSCFRARSDAFMDVDGVLTVVIGRRRSVPTGKPIPSAR
jgi:hypothetical protein